MSVISDYAQSQEWASIGNNSVRIVSQPNGIISEAWQVDLNTGKVISYPGTHSKEARQAVTLTADELSVFRKTIQSKKFKAIPSESEKLDGLDGCSILIEVKIDNKYQWILRWCPDEELITRVCKLLKDAWDKHKQAEQNGAREPSTARLFQGKQVIIRTRTCQIDSPLTVAGR